MNPQFFSKQSDFRIWLENNHTNVQEVWIGFYKKGTGIPTITRSEALDEALCFGWIDGLIKSIDEFSYTVRFTPRRPTSKWSAINIQRVEELKKMGLMKPTGLKVYENRRKQTSDETSSKYENVQLKTGYLEKLKASEKAWLFFQLLPPSKKRLSILWVMSAKKKETQLRRLGVLIRSSEQNKLIPALIIAQKDK